jgi:hypothetical protein
MNRRAVIVHYTTSRTLYGSRSVYLPVEMFDGACVSTAHKRSHFSMDLKHIQELLNRVDQGVDAIVPG